MDKEILSLEMLSPFPQLHRNQYQSLSENLTCLIPDLSLFTHTVVSVLSEFKTGMYIMTV